ncbi:hypothetical protein F5Y04DRAFT_262847 [Hypomontagnella monticulosa]|nr:hypothetical protein F5Y04DRAFT_262847 [Hypomontagnella monticulosa]
MDVAGFTLAVVSLTSLFGTFFDIYDKIRLAKGMGAQLDHDRERLRLESERVRYVREKYQLERFNEDSKRLLAMVMQMLNAQLVGIEALFARYAPEQRSNAPRDATEASGVSAASPGGKGKAIVNRLRWAAGDMADLDRMLDKLHFTTNTLFSFATSESERFRNDFLLRTGALGTLDLAVAMDSMQYPGIAKAARVKRLLQAPATRAATGSSYASSFSIPVPSIRWHNQGGLSQALTSLWATGSRGDEHILVEWRGPFLGGALPRPVAERRLDRLCELLQAMHEAERDEELGHRQVDGVGPMVSFAQLPCVGWTLASELSLTRIGLVFRYPLSHPQMLPSSLYDRISASRRLRVPVPPLGQRFELALGVASAVANIIAVGWLHRAIRSENMLSFGVGDAAVSRLYLVGFSYARPGEDSMSEFSDLPQGKYWALYRPPEARYGDAGLSDDENDDTSSPVLPSAPSAPTASPSDDLYGLGIVLLEIGHWTTAQRMSRAKDIDGDAHAFVKRELPAQVEKLAARCGTIYQDVVRKCLDPAYWSQDDVMDHLASVLESLKLCRA